MRTLWNKDRPGNIKKADTNWLVLKRQRGELILPDSLPKTPTTMRRFLLTALVLLSLSTLSMAGGPWIRSYRKGFLQLGYSGLYYNAVFGPTGSERAVFRNTRDVTLQLYAEYGIAKGWEIRGVLPFKLLKTGPSTDRMANPVPAGTLTGIGNHFLTSRKRECITNARVSLENH